MSEKQHTRLVAVSLNTHGVNPRRPEVEHERNVALADLLHENSFNPLCMGEGPYKLTLSVAEQRLTFDIESEHSGETARALTLSVQPLKRLIRDYFMICESYYAAIAEQSPGRIEAIDMGRRGIHNEGAQTLKSMLDGRVEVDFPTARRLFTLICVLHIR